MSRFNPLRGLPRNRIRADDSVRILIQKEGRRGPVMDETRSAEDAANFSRGREPRHGETITITTGATGQ